MWRLEFYWPHGRKEAAMCMLSIEIRRLLSNTALVPRAPASFCSFIRQLFFLSPLRSSRRAFFSVLTAPIWQQHVGGRNYAQVRANTPICFALRCNGGCTANLLAE